MKIILEKSLVKLKTWLEFAAIQIEVKLISSDRSYYSNSYHLELKLRRQATETCLVLFNALFIKG